MIQVATLVSRWQPTHDTGLLHTFVSYLFRGFAWRIGGRLVNLMPIHFVLCELAAIRISGLCSREEERQEALQQAKSAP